MNNIVLRNVEINWPFLGHVNNTPEYGSGKYEITVLLNAEQAAELQGKISPKQKIKDTEDGRKRLTLKSTMPPMVKGPDGLIWTPEKLDKVGNGTVANVLVNLFESRGSVFAGLGKVLLKTVKEYQAGNSFADLEDEDTQDGFDGLEDD